MRRRTDRFSDELQPKDFSGMVIGDSSNLGAVGAAMAIAKEDDDLTKYKRYNCFTPQHEIKEAIDQLVAQLHQVTRELKKMKTRAHTAETKKNMAFNESFLAEERVSSGMGSSTHYLNSLSESIEAKNRLQLLQKRQQKIGKIISKLKGFFQEGHQVSTGNSHSFFSNQPGSHSVEPEIRGISSAPHTFGSSR
ncbi:hypothetical protein [Candidiatus Paracoxiella cheracis]|uniref:hypothetical protein n=1 Tax=Candidiatus Paracoxiella cheracis TaxID=3405120 RepID=UPI003BF553D2